MSKRGDREGGKVYNKRTSAILFNIALSGIMPAATRIKTYCMLKRLINRPSKSEFMVNYKRKKLFGE